MTRHGTTTAAVAQACWGQRRKARSVDGHHAFAIEAACAAVGASVGVLDRLDAVRDVRNQKYAGIERTSADLRYAQAAFEQF